MNTTILEANEKILQPREAGSLEILLNNGGKTSYYNLPLPERTELNQLLIKYNNRSLTCEETIDSIYKLFPSTLNDLIEYKDMYPFQHEIFKACYALEERANKDIKGGSILRELNKMKYYIERGIALAKGNRLCSN